MHYYRSPYPKHDNRFIGFGFGLPLLGGLVGGLVGGLAGSALFYPRPFYGGYPGYGIGYPGVGYPGVGYPGVGYPGVGYPGYGAPFILELRMKTALAAVFSFSAF